MNRHNSAKGIVAGTVLVLGTSGCAADINSLHNTDTINTVSLDKDPATWADNKVIRFATSVAIAACKDSDYEASALTRHRWPTIAARLNTPDDTGELLFHRSDLATFDSDLNERFMLVTDELGQFVQSLDCNED